jgi:hypothetical protein
VDFSDEPNVILSVVDSIRSIIGLEFAEVCGEIETHFLSR